MFVKNSNYVDRQSARKAVTDTARDKQTMPVLNFDFNIMHDCRRQSICRRKTKNQFKKNKKRKNNKKKTEIKCAQVEIVIKLF